MANILLIDDEPISLRRLFNVLCDSGEHTIWTADNLVAAVNVVERLANSLDLLIIDVSMFEAAAMELLDLFGQACPEAQILVISHLAKHPLGRRYPLMRKPFSNEAFISAVDEVLRFRRPAATIPEPRRKHIHKSSCSGPHRLRIGATPA